MKKILPLLLLGVLALAGCHRTEHFITDAGYRTQVRTDYQHRLLHDAARLAPPQLDTLSLAEQEAMQFLYAYMPLSDLADYDADFFLAQVRTAFQARAEMPWGKTVPEDIFRHFVLVYRVNNENLDTARQLMYRELRDRVRGLSMEEAALEVNHWCHEHVAYRASDGRTSAPLATMRTSLGRCGEESTFAVTALRAVGIPARQCYTPRWAHCDDNHAWVEVWVDGEWKFCGACEPDPRLNMGWFAIPSTRTMMVHSKAFGRYRGDEEVVRRTALYSELNLLSHYAPTRRVAITVLDSHGNPMQGAKVKFKLYNYAEYYPLSTQTTDAAGQAFLTTGLGDLLIWATDGERYAYEKLDVRQDSALTLCLQQAVPQQPLTQLEVVPPAVGKAKVIPTEEESARNAVRLAYEDSLRAAYVSTFHADSPNRYVRLSEGNYAEIEAFLASHPDADDYLSTFSEKDMRDITCSTLEAHLTTNTTALPYDVFKRGLLPARVSNEMVRPYRAELAAFRGMTAEQVRQWVIDSISLSDTANYFGAPLSPRGVYRLRVSDRHSRDIFFVAACRAALIPAYLDNATGEIFVYHQGWQKMTFDEASSTASTARAQLTLTYRGKTPAQPTYWPHYTLQHFADGDFVSLDFEDDPRLAHLPATLSLEPGLYCLSTGNRYPDGSVRSRMEFFALAEGERATKEIVILPLEARAENHGNISPELELFDGVSLSDYASMPGMLYVNLGEYSEPSKHLIVELLQQQKQMAAWGGMTFMVGPQSIGMEQWGLSNTDFAYRAGDLEANLLQSLRVELNGNYPLVALIAADGTIRYYSTGYKIGVIEQVLKAAAQR